MSNIILSLITNSLFESLKLDIIYMTFYFYENKALYSTMTIFQ